MNLNKLHNDIHEGALQLLAEHREQLFAKARMLCASDDEADELVIRTIDQAIRKVNTYAGEGDILAWMKSILVNLHNNDNRSPVVRGTKAVEPGELERCAGADWSTDEQILANSDKDVLMAAINQLDPEYRRLVAMYYFNGLSLREIAVFLNSSTSSVSRKLEVARKILFTKLKTKLGKKPLAVLAAVLTFVSAATAAVATVPALAPVRDTVAAWFAEEDAGGTGVGGTGVPPVQEDVGGTGVPPVQEDVGGTGVPPVQSETVSEPEQEDTTPTQPNTTETTKGKTMNIKKIAAVAGATVLGLSAASADTSVDVENPTTSKNTFVWKGTGTTAEENRWSVGANWEGGVAPTADDIGCVISIPAAAQGSVINNDIANLQVGDVSIAAADGFTLAGEPLALTATGTFSSTTPDFRCEMPFVLAEGAANVFSIAKDLVNTFAADTLRGKGGLKKIGDGRMILEGDNSFGGDFDLTAGYVTMTTDQALGTWWKTVRIGYSYGDAPASLSSSSALKLTQAINFNYNLHFDYKTWGGFSMCCPADTHLCGAIQGRSFALKAASGVLYCDGDISYTGDFSVRGSAVYFRGKISSPGASSMTIGYAGSSARFYSTGNDIGSISVSQGTFTCYTNNVLSDRCYISADSYTYTINMNGYDQICGGFASTERTISGTTCHIISAGTTPCTLTLKPSENRTGRLNLIGPMTLVVDSPNGKTQTVQKVACEMTGDVIVSNGCFKVGADSTFPNVPGVEIAAGGKLILVPGANICNGGNILRRTTGGKLVLQDGAQMEVTGIVKDGEEDTSAYGKAFCAPGAGVAGAEEVDWIEGSGVLTVKANTATHEHTWSGGAGAGGDNESMQNPLNWGLAPTDPAPSLADGTLLPTFATAGTNAWFEGGLMAKGIVFNAPDAFTLTAKDPDGKVGVSELGVTATNKLVNTIDAAVELLSGQTWTANADTTVHVTRGVTSESDYAFNVAGGGKFILEGDVALANNISVSGSRLVLRNGEFTSTSGKIILQDQAANLQLDNAVLSAPLQAVPHSPDTTQLYVTAGTTNLIKSPVTWISHAFIWVEKNSLLTIAANLTDGGYCGLSGADKDSSVLVVTNATVSFYNPTFDNISAHFWSSGNAIGTMNVSAKAQIFLHAENAFVDSSIVYLYGRIDLCGKPQRIGGVSGSGMGSFYSETPGVLSVNKSDENAFNGQFVGEAGLKKLSDGTFTLKSMNPTKGSLEVAGGELIMTSAATWDGTEVSVTAADAKLTLQSSKNLVKSTVLKLTDAAARVNVAAGVQVRVQQMYVPSASRPSALKQLGPGVYTSANCPYVTGEGSVDVRGVGMVLFVY